MYSHHLSLLLLFWLFGNHPLWKHAHSACSLRLHFQGEHWSLCSPSSHWRLMRRSSFGPPLPPDRPMRSCSGGTILNVFGQWRGITTTLSGPCCSRSSARVSLFHRGWKKKTSWRYNIPLGTWACGSWLGSFVSRALMLKERWWVVWLVPSVSLQISHLSMPVFPVLLVFNALSFSQEAPILRS